MRAEKLPYWIWKGDLLAGPKVDAPPAISFSGPVSTTGWLPASVAYPSRELTQPTPPRRRGSYGVDAPQAVTMPAKSAAACCGLATPASGLLLEPSSMNPYNSGCKTGAVLALAALAAPRDDFIRIVPAM